MEQAEKISYDLKMYRATIYDNCKKGDDRLQVRIIPHMLSVDKDELKNLPKYPPLEKGKVIRGITEKEEKGGFLNASRVFVLCTDDFQIGFVLCLANRATPLNFEDFEGSYDQEAISSYLTERGIDSNKFKFEETVIQYSTFDYESGSGLVILNNFKTGDYIILSSSGTFLAVFQGKIVMRVGSPPDQTKGGKENPFSEISITPNKIIVQTETFEVKAKNVILGRTGHRVVGTTSVIPGTGMNAFPLKPMMDLNSGGIFC